MIKGMYTSASGMLPRVKKIELTAHNVANAGTVGYKRQVLFSRELARAERKVLNTQADWEKPTATETFTDFAAGTFDMTGNPLDLAIDGDGFFSLELPDGSTVLTRAGMFTVNDGGFLAFPGGALVLGEGGPIEVGNGKVTVSQNGEVEVNGTVVGRITPVTVENPDSLIQIGNSLYALPQGAQLRPVTGATIRQGYLETANVDVIGEMIEMMVSFRAYEANARALQTQDRSLENLFTRVGGEG
ncbi:MAG TPA: flagellar hook-basal body protein [Candidatus Deferrimicrobium sp.]|nr:flagellar hook-basal body protein [Candidatus Deferrimicrobium sp.]